MLDGQKESAEWCSLSYAIQFSQTRKKNILNFKRYDFYSIKWDTEWSSQFKLYGTAFKTDLTI